MGLYRRRTPRYFDGTATTSHQLSDLLPVVLRGVGAAYGERGDLVMSAWSEVVGPQMARMTQATSFREGILVVHVHNSTLYSLLSRRERPRLLRALREKFPKTTIRNIAFRIG